MLEIDVEVRNIELARELIDNAEKNKDIDIIVEKNFNGDLQTIQLYVDLAALAISTITLAFDIYSLKKNNNLSSLKIDGKKIEVNNVSEELIKKIIKMKMEEKK